MARVVIVSNRLPVSVKKVGGKLILSPSLGGLATGLASYIDDRRGSIWIGWPGIASEELNDQDKQVIAARLAKRSYIPVFLNRKQIDDFYNGYSNSVLWPLLHGLPLAHAKPEILDDWWRAYRQVNRRFAEAVSSLADPTNRIWVHDYLLMLVPEYLRRDLPDANVGLFMHVPFPDARQFSRLPQSVKLLHGALEADLVGFHTAAYAQNFLDTVESLKLGVSGKNRVDLQGRVVRVAEFPMGIDYEKYAGAGKSKGVKVALKGYRKRYRKLKVIVSIDRMDISKGLIERLQAYRKFLELNPGLAGKVVMVMVAAPSRTSLPAHKKLSKRLSVLSDEINATFGSQDWQPVDYINEALPFEAVSALFKLADVAFIVPIKDGMNLAAKEFVASSKRRGVLILSATAGAAEELPDALIVDPSQPETLVNALNQAVHMKRRELRGRLKRMRRHLSVNTVQVWAKTFVETLNRPLPGTPHITRSLNRRIQKHLLDAFRQADKRLLLLDYDGSLVPFKEDYALAVPPKSLIDLLKALSSDPLNDVVMVSGRTAEQLEAWFGNLQISLIAEHGAAIKIAGKTWQIIEKVDTSWKQLLVPALERYTRLAVGSKVEIKPHSLVWHYRGASSYHAQKYSVIIKRVLKPVIKRHGLQMLQGNKALEIKNPIISKGSAVARWLSKSYGFVLALGDDATDEELFLALPLDAYSIKVGRGLTHAHYRLASYREVLKLLRKLV